MSLKAVVSDINSVDEGLRNFYKEADGKFVLQVEPTEGLKLENVDGLVSALGAERNLKKSLEDKLKPFEGIDAKLAREAIARVAEYGDLTPEQAREAKETAERLAALDPKKDAERIAAEKIDAEVKKFQAQAKARETELLQQLEQTGGAVNSLKTQLKTLMVDNVVKSELANLSPLDDARDAIQLLAERSIRTTEVDGQFVVQVVDDAGVPRIKDVAGTPVSVGDLLAEIKEKKPGLFKAENKSGVGVRPDTGSGGNQAGENPWVQGPNFNRTKQALITKQNPELAKRLKAAAGAA